jgi:hypothetical protein
MRGPPVIRQLTQDYSRETPHWLMVMSFSINQEANRAGDFEVYGFLINVWLL